LVVIPEGNLRLVPTTLLAGGPIIAFCPMSGVVRHRWGHIHPRLHRSMNWSAVCPTPLFMGIHKKLRQETALADLLVVSVN
jgi:hypothetical protein